MKFMLLIFAIFAVANCNFIPNPYDNLLYIPRLPKLNGKTIGNISPLIDGGTEAVPNSIPYEAGLYIDGFYFCDGTLISNEWVLTAAHCTTGARSVEVVLGAHDLSVNESTQIRVSSTGENIHTHEGYDPRTLENDVGLLKFDNPISLTNEVQPAILPNIGDADLGGGLNVVMSGYGLYGPNGGGFFLKVATVVTVTNDECESFYKIDIYPSTLCTSLTDTNSGTCVGGSGGPLTYDSGFGPVHRGVTSFGPAAGCTSGGYEGFDRTTHYRVWINETAGI